MSNSVSESKSNSSSERTSPKFFKILVLFMLSQLGLLSDPISEIESYSSFYYSSSHF